MIPLCDLRRQYAALKDEVDHAMQQVAADAHYILGPNVQALEQEIAEHVSEHCLSLPMFPELEPTQQVSVANEPAEAVHSLRSSLLQKQVGQ